jgi:hypothetical protein
VAPCPRPPTQCVCVCVCACIAVGGLASHLFFPSTSHTRAKQTSAPLREILGRLYDMGEHAPDPTPDAPLVAWGLLALFSIFASLHVCLSTTTAGSILTIHRSIDPYLYGVTGVREHVMVEGGPRTARAFLETNVVDRVVIYQVSRGGGRRGGHLVWGKGGCGQDEGEGWRVSVGFGLVLAAFYVGQIDDGCWAVFPLFFSLPPPRTIEQAPIAFEGEPVMSGIDDQLLQRYARACIWQKKK